MSEGYQPSQIFSLKGLTDLEEVVGKKQLAELLGDFIIKPEGRPTLAPESDKRPSITTSAADDFNDDFKD